MTKGAPDEAAAALEATSTRQWSDHEKQLLQSILDLGHEEVDALLRWVTSIRRNSASTAETDSPPAINPVRWSL